MTAKEKQQQLMDAAHLALGALVSLAPGGPNFCVCITLATALESNGSESTHVKYIAATRGGENSAQRNKP